MTEQNMFRWDADDAGIVVLTMDDPSQSANTMNETFASSLVATVDRLVSEKDSITGVVITSAKKTFFAGGDLHLLMAATSEDAGRINETTTTMKLQFRRLETLGRPVVAAINGAALGGGYEIALACHHRIALDAKGSQIGLPEVTLGLLPGGGGVVRTVRLLGIQSALLNVLLQGQRHKPRAALGLGMIDEVVDTPDDLLAKAKEWIKANPDAVQPWDAKGYKIPGGTPTNPSFAANLPAFPANLRKQLKGRADGRPRATSWPPRSRARWSTSTRRPRSRRILRRAGHRPDQHEHDQGVLLRPPAHQLRRQPPRGLPEARSAPRSRARRRHDGRGHRIR